MSEDPIRKYSDARSELDKATAKVLAIGSTIRDVAYELGTRPYEIMVSNVDVEFPIEVARAEGVFRLNADNWPNARQIAEALASLHQKRKRVNEIWASLSAVDKKLVNPPDAS